jgi:hypothetical protein
MQFYGELEGLNACIFAMVERVRAIVALFLPLAELGLSTR